MPPFDHRRAFPGRTASGRTTPAVFTSDDLDRDLTALMQDPLYWRERDRDFADHVTRQFERVHGPDGPTPDGDGKRRGTLEVPRLRRRPGDDRLKQPVGRYAPNRPDDVARLQRALSETGDYTFTAPRERSGVMSPNLDTAVTRYQRRTGLEPDGYVAPNGPTIQQIAAEAENIGNRPSPPRVSRQKKPPEHDSTEPDAGAQAYEYDAEKIEREHRRWMAWHEKGYERSSTSDDAPGVQDVPQGHRLSSREEIAAAQDLMSIRAEIERERRAIDKKRENIRREQDRLEGSWMNDAPDIPKRGDESQSPSRRKHADDTNSERSDDDSRQNGRTPRSGNTNDMMVDFGNGIADFALQKQYEARQSDLEKEKQDLRTNEIGSQSRLQQLERLLRNKENDYYRRWGKWPGTYDAWDPEFYDQPRDKPF